MYISNHILFGKAKYRQVHDLRQKSLSAVYAHARTLSPTVDNMPFLSLVNRGLISSHTFTHQEACAIP